MPEGDTIWRTAQRLVPVLRDQVVTSFSAQRLTGQLPEPGWTVTDVEARGKYLLVHFDALDGSTSLTLETHMKMTGSWHIYRSGERWRKSANSARAVIEVESGWLAVCFAAPHVVLRSNSAGPTHLGPDLCRSDVDLEAAAAAFSIAAPETEVGVALLDQRICCGVGNVYKSEVLHACALAPRTAVADVPGALRLELVTTAHRMLSANLGSGPRITTSTTRSGLAVYGRAGSSCMRCGGVVERFVQGEHVRSTYWCPGCQLEPGVTRPDS